MKKFILSLLLLFVICNFSFAEDNSLEKVKKDGFFILGLDDTFPPFGFKDENGEIVGFDIDLAKEVAKRLNVEVKFKPCEWDGIIFELRSKKIDLVWNGMSVSPEREKQVSFSEPYHKGGQYIFSKKEVSIKKVAELEGKVVGVQLGSTGANAVEKSSISPKLKELKKYGSTMEAIADLEAGRLDAVVMALSIGGYYNSKKDSLTASDESLSNEDSGIAFRKEDNAFRDAVNKALEEMRTDGTFRNIEKKWFGDIIGK
ncbi:amino acid ABC transporter substrate-binding protein [Fusobacterium sp. PH5-44]|uniref:amino acid ABC transporter substrate-binding protein n=1 Tax=unclassified Fusobacterium TaxID=2648384 RepID=UPI003D2373B5